MADSNTKDPVPVVATQRSDELSRDVTATTPRGLPNILIKTMHPIAQVLVRAVRAYLQAFLGIATALQTGYAHKLGVDFDTHDLGTVIAKSAAIALAPVFYTIVQNVIELFAKLDETYPQLRA